MRHIKFTVDSALLRELGERLVGKAHIALAELIKNSYDADATLVEVQFGDDMIVVADNGHGMDLARFRNFWMRIGTTNKEAQGTSLRFGRALTGSKGVGRLAVQFLGDQLEMHTVFDEGTDAELVAFVDWRESIKAGELTEAEAAYQLRPRTSSFPGEKKHGTQIIIRTLKQRWDTKGFADLAREIWTLQPPYGKAQTPQRESFEVRLDTPNREDIAGFQNQMRALLSLWEARISGRLTRSDAEGKSPGEGHAELTLQFVGQSPIEHKWVIPQCHLSDVEFDIHVYNLVSRQRFGIKVDKAREYLRHFGGVHVYDGGFHLPYYGRPDTDWLEIEYTHSHRLTTSPLLPPGLQVPRGMNYLPTQSRLLGAAHISTSRERTHACDDDFLAIQVTRDRLTTNTAYAQLRDLVRYALDYYAVHEARRAFDSALTEKPVEPVTAKVARVETVLEQYRDEIPKPVYERLEHEVSGAVRASDAEAAAVRKHLGLLGALATAGMAAIAFQHEFVKQLHLLATTTERLEGILKDQPALEVPLRSVANDLRGWLERTRATQAIFTPLMSAEDRDMRLRLRARLFLEQLLAQLQPLLRGVPVDLTSLAPDLRLPLGGFSEWAALFQNLLLNAVSAMLDTERKKITISSERRGKAVAILVLDTGVGVDLAASEELFQPFVRKLELSDDRRRLNLGGSGLGLTIVRMLADQLNCAVSFVRPRGDYSTAVQIRWSEKA